MIYWDTSVILKLYAEEADSRRWQALALGAGGPLRTSAVAFAEMAHALKQKELRGEIAPGAAPALFRLFEEDVNAGRFLLLPLGMDILAHAAATAIGTGTLRTLDGLHLSTALRAQCSRVATTDNRLAEAAAGIGLEVVPAPAAWESGLH